MNDANELKGLTRSPARRLPTLDEPVLPELLTVGELVEYIDHARYCAISALEAGNPTEAFRTLLKMDRYMQVLKAKTPQ